MLERIFRMADMKTGMYTSPHLTYLGERVQIDRTPISKDKLCEYVDELKIVADSIFDVVDKSSYPSFFEFMTALAFLEFSSEKVNCAVVEVGLGGRLDSTNIVLPEISVITSIGLDHIQMLGSTIAEIAREKAGIIKREVPVVCGFLPKEAMDVVEAVALEKSAPLYKTADYFPTEDSLPQTSLFGLYQRRNAALALLCSRVLRESAEAGKTVAVFGQLRDELVLAALSDVQWAARWQRVELANGGTLILDSSHNEEGARMLESNLANFDFGGKKPIIAIGVLGEERARPIMDVVKKYARKIILLVPDQPRALGFDSLRRCLGDCAAEVVCAKVSDIYKSGNVCTAAGRGDTIVSTGSIYLAGEVLGALSGDSSDNLQDRP